MAASHANPRLLHHNEVLVMRSAQSRHYFEWRLFKNLNQAHNAASQHMQPEKLEELTLARKP